MVRRKLKAINLKNNSNDNLKEGKKDAGDKEIDDDQFRYVTQMLKSQRIIELIR